MFIDIKRISDKGFSLSDTAELDENFLIEEGGFFLKNVDYNVLFLRDGTKIKIKGKIKTSVSLRCIRCTEFYEFKINSKFDLILFPANLIEFSNTSLNPDEMEYIFYEGNKIDLAKVLVEQVNLFIPYNPICSPECKGICQNCGMNLNKYECKCDNSLDEFNFLFNKLKR